MQSSSAHGRSTARLPSRRQFLATIGGLTGVAALAACSTTARTPGGGGSGVGAPSGGATGGSGNLSWWDQFAPLESLQRKTFEAFTAAGHPTVDYTVYNPADQGKALQLAFGSKQLPDAFSLAGVSVPPSVLLGQGWFSPLSTADKITAALPKGTLVDGIHIFDGKLYSFPLFSPRQYDALVWGNKSVLEKAGLDTETLPASWPDLRAAAKKLTAAGTPGLMMPLKFADRMQAFVLQLALAAGFPGVVGGSADGIDITTGEYNFHHEAFIQTLEFLLSFQQDRTLFTASTSLDARAARARWAAGGSGYILDGPYSAGVVVKDFATFADQLTVGSIPTPDGSAPILTHAPTGGTFWASGQTDQADQVGELLLTLTSQDYQAGLAAAMDQPPLDLDAVAGSSAHPTYQKLVTFFAKQVFLGPSAEATDPKVSQVVAATKQVEPTLGTIVQGVFSGQINDVTGALRKLSDDSTAARKAAIASVAGAPADAWKFPKWVRGKDFTAADYPK